MFLPVAVLIGPYLVGAMSAAALLVGMHVLMLPAMVLAMLHRRDEYAQGHHRHRDANRRLAKWDHTRVASLDQSGS